MAKRILVVDDDACGRFVIDRSIAGMGSDYEVVTAGDAAEALAHLAEADFDLVITDLCMPGVDGIQLTAAIRSAHPGLVIVWMTAHNCQDVACAARRLGVKMCLDKPLEVDEIRASVAAAIEGTARTD